MAARLGVRCQDPVILNDGANIIVHLSPAPVVAKVAGCDGRRPEPGSDDAERLALLTVLGTQALAG